MHPPSTALFEKIFLLNNRLRGGTKFKFPRHVYSIRRTILVCCRLRVRDQRSKTKKEEIQRLPNQSIILIHCYLGSYNLHYHE